MLATAIAGDLNWLPAAITLPLHTGNLPLFAVMHISTNMLLLGLGIGALLVLLIGLVVFTDRAVQERLLSRRARLNQEYFNRSPERAAIIAQRIEKKILTWLRSDAGDAWRENPFPWLRNGSPAFMAYIMCEVVLAADESRQDSFAQASKRINQLRRVLPTESERHRYLLPYYLWTKQFSPEAIQACVAIITNSKQRRSNWRQRAVDHLERFCAPEHGSNDEIRRRIQVCNELRRVSLAEEWVQRHEAGNWLQLKDYRAAIRTLTESLENTPNDWRARVLLGKCHLGLNQSAFALAEVRKLQQIADSADCALETANLLWRLDRTDEAEQTLAQIDQRWGEAQSQVRLLRGKLLWSAGRHEAAIEQWRPTAGMGASDADTALVLAEALSSRKDPNGSLAVLEAFKSEALARPDFAYALGAAYWNLARYDEAADWLWNCVKGGFRRQTTVFLLCRALIYSKRHVEISRVFDLVAPGEGKLKAEADFYRGVAVADLNPLLASQFFLSAYKVAKDSNVTALANVAAGNVIALRCRLGNERIAKRNYAQAIRELEFVDRNLSAADQRHSAVRRTLAECYTRVALDNIKVSPEAGRAAAVLSLTKSLSLVDNPQLRFVLGGLHAAESKYAEAAKCYDQLLNEQPGNETLRFARALCAQRLGHHEQAISEFEVLSREGREVALRSALAVAEWQLNSGDSQKASATLATAARKPNARKDSYYGDVCCRAVLNSLTAGEAGSARELAVELFKETKHSSELILGTLLAQAGIWDDALPYLEQATTVADAQRPLLEGVYARAVHQRCQKKQFGDANRMAQQAAKQTGNTTYDAIENLSQLATSVNGNGVAVDATMVQHLETAGNCCDSYEPLIGRATLAGNLLLADDLAHAARHKEALSYFTRAVEIWRSLIQGRSAFWEGYVFVYNAGKDRYQLDRPASELETDLRKRLGGYLVRMSAALIEGRAHCHSDQATAAAGAYFDHAAAYWALARELLSTDEAYAVFDKVFSFVRTTQLPAYKTNNQAQLRLAKFLYDQLGARDEYRIAVSNLSMQAALSALISVETSQFQSLLNQAGEVEKSLKDVAEKVRRFGAHRIQLVVELFLQDPRGKQLLLQNRPRAELVAFLLVTNTAALIEQHPEVTNQQIVLIFPKILELVLQSNPGA